MKNTEFQLIPEIMPARPEKKHRDMVCEYHLRKREHEIVGSLLDEREANIFATIPELCFP